MRAANLLAGLILGLGGLGGQESRGLDPDQVAIEYVAHACFRIYAPDGTRILIDPYASRVWLGYDFPADIEADVVLISHPHYDHDGGQAMGRSVPWDPETTVLRDPEAQEFGDLAAFDIR